MKPSSLTFILLGPASSFLVLQAITLAVTVARHGWSDKLIAQGFRIWDHLGSIGGFIAWLACCLPAFLSAVCFDRFLAASQRLRIHMWFALAVVAMCFGPGLASLIVLNNPVLIFVTVVACGLVPVMICGLIARRLAPDPSAAF